MSRSSSRSTSFNLPNDSPDKTNLRVHSPGHVNTELIPLSGGEVEEEEEDVDPVTAAKHEAFVRARGRHYSNEAEAMKRAQELMAHEDEEEESSTQEAKEDESMDQDTSESSEVESSVPVIGQVNGIKRS